MTFHRRTCSSDMLCHVGGYWKNSPEEIEQRPCCIRGDLWILREWIEHEIILIYLAKLTIGTRAMQGCGMSNSNNLQLRSFNLYTLCRALRVRKVDERERDTPRHGTNLTMNERSSSYLPHGGLILQPVGYFLLSWRVFHLADRSQKNRNTQGVEKHAPEAVFDGRGSGYTVKDRTKRGAWGSTKPGSSFSLSPKMPGSLTTDPRPKIQLR